MNMAPRSTARPGGFTLIELLVVVAIIGVLATLVVGATQRGIVSAHQQKCAGNLRQIGVALQVYANDHDGWLPATSHTAGSQREAWIFTLRPYLGNVDAVRVSPGDPKGRERLAANGTSYILNSIVFVPRVGPFGEALEGSMNNVRKISHPTRTLLAANISDRQGVSGQNDHTHSEQWAGNWGRVCADIQPDRFTTGARGDQTAGSANYLFADGHVENIAADELKRRVDRGENPAQPPEA